MATPTELLNRRISGAPPEEQRGQFLGLFEGEISRVVGGELWFTIPDFARHIEFGPAHYPRPPAETGAESGGGGDESFAEHSHDLRSPDLPPEGAYVIVGFVNGDPDRPEVLKIKGWLGA